MIPYFSWSFIYWIFNLIYFYILKKKCRHTLLDFLINLVNGHIFNCAFWFQNILILITIIFAIIILLLKNIYMNTLLLIGLLAYIFQYTGLNYQFFIKNFSFHYFFNFWTVCWRISKCCKWIIYCLKKLYYNTVMNNIYNYLKFK